MALAHTPATSHGSRVADRDPAALSWLDASPSLGPSWLQARFAPQASEPPCASSTRGTSGTSSVASVHPIRPGPAHFAPAPGIESHPAFQHPAFEDPGFDYPTAQSAAPLEPVFGLPGYEHPSFQEPSSAPAPPVVEQWATVLPFVRSNATQAAPLPVIALDQRRPLDYRPMWMGAAFLASSLCVYASSAPTWVADPVALGSDSLLQRLAATSFQLLGPVTLTVITGISAVAFLVAGTHRLPVGGIEA